MNAIKLLTVVIIHFLKYMIGICSYDVMMTTIFMGLKLSRRREEEGCRFVEFAYSWVIGRPWQCCNPRSRSYELSLWKESFGVEYSTLVWCSHLSPVRASPEMKFPQWTQLSPAKAIEERCQNKHRIPSLSQWSLTRAWQGERKEWVFEEKCWFFGCSSGHQPGCVKEAE